MTSRPYKYVYGPVPSRRLGRSLGVDLVPFKTCTYDCVYCQLGRTTAKTLERKEYVPAQEILSELDRKLGEGAPPDYVTLSGSGEPTLHSRLGELVAGIKRLTSIPLAVLTNGSLLWDPAVRRGLAGADVVIPSLDAGDERGFRRVNRPHPGLSFDRVVEGLRACRREFKGRMWIEVLLVGGITGVPKEAGKIARLAEEISPDKIQLNTVTRPPAESFALAVSPERMRRMRKVFGVRAEVVADFAATEPLPAGEVEDGAILSLLRRRPCTVRDIARGIGLRAPEAAKRAAALHKSGALRVNRRGGRVFYVAAERAPGTGGKRK